MPCQIPHAQSHAHYSGLIVAKYGFDQEASIPSGQRSRNFSWIWRDISKPLLNPEDAFTSKLRVSVGNGLLTNFWEDYWTDTPSLKLTFPRIYALAVKKSGRIAEFRSLVNGVWVWKVELRRRLFDWELDLWSTFLSMIQKAAPRFNTRDSLKWSGSSNGLYSPKAFCEAVALGEEVPNYMWRVVWSNLAPPNVEAFLWKVIHLRVGKEGYDEVGVKHLCRNELIFNKMVFLADKIFELAVLRIGHWCRSKWPECIPSILEFTRGPQFFSVQMRKMQRPIPGFWKALEDGFVKFNVDATVKGGDGFAGIGGVLRDHTGKVVTRFSKLIGVSDSTSAKLQEILEACRHFASYPWFGVKSLIIESDSELAGRKCGDTLPGETRIRENLGVHG
ncbi:hypothetical protein GQ457_10G004110 [Hibiscus cannabinus]